MDLNDDPLENRDFVFGVVLTVVLVGAHVWWAWPRIMEGMR